jgi:hypothetical protein
MEITEDCANLERTIVLLTDMPRQFDHALHPLDLPFDLDVKVRLFHFGEAQKVDRTSVSCESLCWNEGPE